MQCDLNGLHVAYPGIPAAGKLGAVSGRLRAQWTGEQKAIIRRAASGPLRAAVGS